MSRFSFLDVPSMSEFDNLDEREAIIEDFLLEKSINIVWGKSGLGKTWLCFGLCKMLANEYDILYLDADNGIDLVKDRGYDKLLRTLPITYVNADFFDDNRAGMQRITSSLVRNANNGYKKALFIFDSLAFFLDGNLYDEKKISEMLFLFKRIRRHGGTVIIIAHATKSGNMFRGSSNLVNAVDELWEVEAMPSLESELNFVCSPYKQRLNLRQCGFNVKTETCDLTKVNPYDLMVKDNEWDIIKQVKDELLHKELSQSNLLKALGKNKGDKVYLRVLKRFDGIYWFSSIGKNRSVIYSLEKNKEK